MHRVGEGERGVWGLGFLIRGGLGIGDWGFDLWRSTLRLDSWMIGDWGRDRSNEGGMGWDWVCVW